VIATAGLALATAAFVGSHLAMSHPLRLKLVGAMGEHGFLLLYSLVSFVTLALMVVGWRAVGGNLPLWQAPAWAWWAGSAIMLLVSILLAGSLVRNPAFPNPGVRAWKPPAAKGVFAITRHPMNWSFILWALVHLLLWGSERNLIVAGGILILAAAGSAGQDRKKRSVLGPPWLEWERRTSFVPFGALLAGRASWSAALPDWRASLGGLIFWLLVTWYHAPLVSPLALLLGR
jgi:uncharacterized membrane protein